MVISIIFVVVVIFALFVLGICLIGTSAEHDSFGMFLTGVIFLVIFGFLGFQICRNIPKVEDPDRESFYNITKIEFVDGTSRQISILPNGRTIDITNIGESKIYPENSILRKYGYKAESGWIKYDNKNSFYYEVIMPSNKEKYEKAREKITKIKISDNSDNFPELEKEELYDYCYINREEEKL